MAAAFMQYYRETAHYLERTSKWIERMGLEHVREVLFDEEGRSQLVGRIEEALSYTKEPWKEIINNKETKEKLFESLSV